ncbi:serine/threonine-protein kinase [Nocardia sp. BMG51109]|uniref:serine/threonine-protein kinase n=1 Tax=Nocardia sp. BMG51109 TaxID=1056816 RepID=UPI0009FF5374|nr:serine/threonine-protein kinase [Nocardia sp. BMG51109]
MRTLVDRYRITSPIGRGGMGEVWSGTDVRLNREVAIKLVSSEHTRDSDARRRFHREARITARLHHPGVPAVFDFGEDKSGEDDELFLIMELVPGQTVGTLLGEYDGLTVGWAASITAQVCAVLAAAHSVDLIHRDIKPENLVLAPNGTIKLIDFGAATSLRVGEYSSITQNDQPPLSLNYMAPELWESMPASRASDVFAVGVLLHELLTGSKPFAYGPGPIGYGNTVELEPLVEVPTELDALIRQLLSVDASQRPSALAVHGVLIPWVRDLPSLPGWLDRNLSEDPVHLYLDAMPNPE